MLSRKNVKRAINMMDTVSTWVERGRVVVTNSMYLQACDFVGSYVKFTPEEEEIIMQYASEQVIVTYLYDKAKYKLSKSIKAVGDAQVRKSFLSFNTDKEVDK